MKFCSFCGAPLAGSAVSFCSECGKRVQKKAERKAPSIRNLRIKGKLFATRLDKPNYEEADDSIYKSEEIPADTQETAPPIDPQDVNYDGYYNDVLPEDEGYIRERIEPELIKRIAFVIGGMLLVVILSVLIINVL